MVPQYLFVHLLLVSITKALITQFFQGVCMCLLETAPSKPNSTMHNLGHQRQLPALQRKNKI